jgi:hypothetical protein
MIAKYAAQGSGVSSLSQGTFRRSHPRGLRNDGAGSQADLHSQGGVIAVLKSRHDDRLASRCMSSISGLPRPFGGGAADRPVSFRSPHDHRLVFESVMVATRPVGFGRASKCWPP